MPCDSANYSNRNKGYAASILTEYQVAPFDLRLQPNLLGVKFDFARQVDANEDVIYLQDYVWRESTTLPDKRNTYGLEGCNDDGGSPNAVPPVSPNNDEDLTPSLSNRIYSFDAPGFFYNGFFDPADNNRVTYWQRVLNFKEFARISFNIQPGGDGSVQGSRCSEYVPWQTTYNLKRTALPNVVDPFDHCNHYFTQVDNVVSHSEVTRLRGNDSPEIDVSLVGINTNTMYKFTYTDVTNQEWTLEKRDATVASGLRQVGVFTLNNATNSWTLEDSGNIIITIKNLPNGIALRTAFAFTINNSPVNNFLD